MSEVKTGLLNLNSIMLFAVISVLGWIGWQTYESSISLVALRTKVEMYMTQQADLPRNLAEINTKLSGSVTQDEYRAKMLNLEARIHEIEIDIIRLKKLPQ